MHDPSHSSFFDPGPPNADRLARQHALSAYRHYEEQRWESALRELRLAVAYEPGRADWLVGMGMTLEQLHRFAEAAEAFAQALEVKGEEAETLLRLCVDLLRSEQPGPALLALNRLERVAPDLHSVHAYRVLAHTLRGDHEEAELHFYLGQQVAPDCPLAYDHLGHSLAIRGLFDRAIGCWKRVLELDPFYPGVHLSLARALWQQRETLEAERAFREHLAQEPDDAQAALDLARLLMSTGRAMQADAILARVGDRSTDFNVCMVRGDLALARREYTSADAHYRRAMWQAPDKPGPRRGLAEIAHRCNRPNSAVRYACEDAACEGHDPQQMVALARLFIELDRPARALGLLTDEALPSARLPVPSLNASDHTPRVQALLVRAEAWLAMGNTRRAIAQLARARRLQSQDPQLFVQQARLYLAIKRPELATALYRRLKTAHPHHVSIKHLRRARRWAKLRTPRPTLSH